MPEQEDQQEEVELIMSVVDGTRHKEDGATRKAEIEGVVHAEDKDFLGMTEVHQATTHVWKEWENVPKRGRKHGMNFLDRQTILKQWKAL